MKNSFVLILFCLISIKIFTACTNGDDPVQSQEDHYKAIGVIFFQSGNRIASIIRGVTSDTLIVGSGTESDFIEVKFYDENENIMDSPSDELQNFDWEVKDKTVVEIIQNPSNKGKFGFFIKGISPGNTTVEFFILHEGHTDFRSGDVPVKVF